MNDGLLEDIIEYEKRIQQDLAAEEKRCAAWAAKERATLDDALSKARLETEKDNGDALSKARQEALREAKALQWEAEQWCRRLTTLEDRVLRDILIRHLHKILPETDCDHPHGES